MSKKVTNWWVRCKNCQHIFVSYSDLTLCPKCQSANLEVHDPCSTSRTSNALPPDLETQKLSLLEKLRENMKLLEHSRSWAQAADYSVKCFQLVESILKLVILPTSTKTDPPTTSSPTSTNEQQKESSILDVQDRLLYLCSQLNSYDSNWHLCRPTSSSFSATNPSGRYVICEVSINGVVQFSLLNTESASRPIILHIFCGLTEIESYRKLTFDEQVKSLQRKLWNYIEWTSFFDQGLKLLWTSLVDRIDSCLLILKPLVKQSRKETESTSGVLVSRQQLDKLSASLSSAFEGQSSLAKAWDGLSDVRELLDSLRIGQ